MMPVRHEIGVRKHLFHKKYKAIVVQPLTSTISRDRVGIRLLSQFARSSVDVDIRDVSKEYGK